MYHRFAVDELRVVRKSTRLHACFAPAETGFFC